VLELDADKFRFDPAYPDVATKRGADFVLNRNPLVRSWPQRQGEAQGPRRHRACACLPRPVSIRSRWMVVFVETAWENWAFAGGRLLPRRVTGPAVTRRETGLVAWRAGAITT
jgi:hypothetical protein